jgi:hypothetical protein
MLQGKKWRRFRTYAQANVYLHSLSSCGLTCAGIGFYLEYDMSVAYQPCLKETAVVKKKYTTKLVYLNHYTVTRCCREIQAICLRQHTNRSCTITFHPVGECPLCDYRERGEGEAI